ncbi:MAG: hypothetical protein COA58_10270 [Bacteroidetes bacterium]|nr:MAG: hypothetical protein COA58_10270 [Bacteroidota bacterium]
MKPVYFSLFILFLLSSCYNEDSRANDFDLEYWLEDEHCRPQVVKGSILNLSSNPADKVKIKVDMYQCGYG